MSSSARAHAFNKICRICEQTYYVDTTDLEFYSKVSPSFANKRFIIPPPTLCPDCRVVLKLAYTNDLYLFHRVDSWSGKQIISTYTPDTPFPVISRDTWEGDSWDPMQFGSEIDPKADFFLQWLKLRNLVPRPSREVIGCENCEYSIKTYFSKNCYMTVGFNAEDCIYGLYTRDAKCSMDYYFLINSNECYELINCSGCYEVFYSQYAANCSCSYLLFDCKSCRNCFGCVNLSNKQYCVFNEQLSEASYSEFIQNARLGSRASIEQWRSKFTQFKSTLPKRSVLQELCEDSEGSNIKGLKNCVNCFDSDALQSRFDDCKNVIMSAGAVKDCHDMFGTGDGTELCYHCGPVAYLGQRMLFCVAVNNAYDVLFCDLCRHIKNCFGCIGLNKKEYCILNKQYTKNDYEQTVAAVISKMQSSNTWGEFFPASFSPYPYNRSMAMFRYPLTREEASRSDFNWSNYEPPPPEIAASSVELNIPDSIADVTDDIIGKTIFCSQSGKPFKIISQELAFYRRHSLPVPNLHPDERRRERAILVAPYKLFDRTCVDCGKTMKSGYSLDVEPRVLCYSCWIDLLC